MRFDYFGVVHEALKEAPPYTDREIEAVRYFTKGKLDDFTRKKIEIKSTGEVIAWEHPSLEGFFMGLTTAIEEGQKVGKLDNFHYIHGRQEDIDKMVRLWELKTRIEAMGGVEEVLFDILARLEAIEKRLKD